MLFIHPHRLSAVCKLQAASASCKLRKRSKNKRALVLIGLG
jgi:hypothetical protein